MAKAFFKASPSVRVVVKFYAQALLPAALKSRARMLTLRSANAAIRLYTNTLPHA